MEHAESGRRAKKAKLSADALPGMRERLKRLLEKPEVGQLAQERLDRIGATIMHWSFKSRGTAGNP